MNGSKSRGPVTAAGTDRIRSSALKQGLTARLALWRNENAEHFQDLLVALLEQFAPANDVEFLCVEEMALAKWRLRRVVSLETAAGNKHLAATTATGCAATLAAFSAAQQGSELMTTLRQHEAAYGRAGRGIAAAKVALQRQQARQQRAWWESGAVVDGTKDEVILLDARDACFEPRYDFFYNPTARCQRMR